MTTANELFSPVYELVGKRITDVGVYYDLLILAFEEHEIHASCFTRVIHNDQILFTTQDYQSWDEKEQKHNDMYVNIGKNAYSLVDHMVERVELSPVNDLVIVLDNQVRIEIFNSNGFRLRFTEQQEQWFLYKPDDQTYPYLSVNNDVARREIIES